MFQGSKICVSSMTKKLNEDNQQFRFGCPPDSQIFLEKNILKIIVHTNPLSFDSKAEALQFPKNISFWELKK